MGQEMEQVRPPEIQTQETEGKHLLYYISAEVAGGVVLLRPMLDLFPQTLRPSEEHGLEWTESKEDSLKLAMRVEGCRWFNLTEWGLLVRVQSPVEQ